MTNRSTGGWTQTEELPVLWSSDDESVRGQIVADLTVGESRAAHAVGEDDERPLLFRDWIY